MLNWVKSLGGSGNTSIELCGSEDERELLLTSGNIDKWSEKIGSTTYNYIGERDENGKLHGRGLRCCPSRIEKGMFKNGRLDGEGEVKWQKKYQGKLVERLQEKGLFKNGELVNGEIYHLEEPYTVRYRGSVSEPKNGEAYHPDGRLYIRYRDGYITEYCFHSQCTYLGIFAFEGGSYWPTLVCGNGLRIGDNSYQCGFFKQENSKSGIKLTYGFTYVLSNDKSVYFVFDGNGQFIRIELNNRTHEEILNNAYQSVPMYQNEPVPINMLNIIKGTDDMYYIGSIAGYSNIELSVPFLFRYIEKYGFIAVRTGDHFSIFDASGKLIQKEDTIKEA